MNTPWLNYHHLFYFKTIAEEQGVSKAAKKLRLGQSTLSAQLKQFEENLGVELFERKHKRLILSEHGKIALNYAQSIFKMGGEMYEVLHDQVKASRTHVQIGALDSISKQIISQLVKAAYRIGPCNISLIEGKSDELIRELTAHQIDLFVSNYIPTSVEAKGLNYRSIVKKPVSIFGSPKFKTLRKKFPESLRGSQFIVPTFDSKLRHDVEHWLKVHGLNVDIIAETQDTSLKKLLAIDGLGLIPTAHHNVTSQVANGELVEIGPLTGISEELFLISAQRKIANPIASQLIKIFNI